MERSTDVLKSPWTQRPRRIVLDNGLLWLSTNWIEMNGFPPVPPRTGCLGIVTLCPAGITTAVAVDSTVKVWVPARFVFEEELEAESSDGHCSLKGYLWSGGVVAAGCGHGGLDVYRCLECCAGCCCCVGDAG